MLGKVAVDPVDYASAGNAILGIRNSGKTYSATFIAEQLFTAGIPFIAFDPIGVWRFLRVPGKGAGYQVVVIGGQAPDLDPSPEFVPEIVRAAMKSGVSLVIDLYNIKLSKADWRRIVTDCLALLLHENGPHGLRHIFIEEAAEFAPQRIGPEQGRAYAEVEKLARMGGNARLGYTLINQRAEEVNKAVLELCDNLFLHRQKGRNSLNALGKWLALADVQPSGRKIVKSLPTLPQGQCWAWLGGTDVPVLVEVPEKNSFHPDRRVMRGDAPSIAKAAVDVSEFVESLRKLLEKKGKPANGGDKAKPSVKADTPPPGGLFSRETVEQAKAVARADGIAAGKAEARREATKLAWSIAHAINKLHIDIVVMIEEHELSSSASAPSTALIPQAGGPPPSATPTERKPRSSGTQGETSSVATNHERAPGDIGKGAQRLLDVLVASHPLGVPAELWGGFAEASSGGGWWNTQIKALRGAGYIELIDGSYFSTIAGRKASGTLPAEPKDEAALWRLWREPLRKLIGPAGMTLLSALAAYRWRQLTVEQWGLAAGKSPTGGWWNSAVKGLREWNCIEQGGGRFWVNEKGLALLDGQKTPLIADVGGAFRAARIAAMPPSSQRLFAVFHDAMSREELSEAAGIKRSGGYWNEALRGLLDSGLVIEEESGRLSLVAEELPKAA